MFYNHDIKYNAYKIISIVLENDVVIHWKR